MKKQLITIAALVLTVVSCTTLMESDAPFESQSDASFPEWLKMIFDKGPYPPVSQDDIDSVVENIDVALINAPSPKPRATWIGHATMLVQYRGINFLTDPHLTKRAAPVDFIGPIRLVPPAISFEDMPRIDFIVISHNHYDHLDHRTVDLFGNSVKWYVPMGLKKWFINRGIKAKQVVELGWWQTDQFNPEVKVTFTPSVHWSKRAPWDTNESHWGSWSVKIDSFNSWFGGDTGYDKKLFKVIGEKTGPFDMAFIPIGAYEPRSFMLRQHVDPSQAVLVHQDIKSKKSIPIHWGTFQLTHEPFLEPPALLEDEMKKAGLSQAQFEPVNVGKTVEVELGLAK